VETPLGFFFGAPGSPRSRFLPPAYLNAKRFNPYKPGKTVGEYFSRRKWKISENWRPESLFTGLIFNNKFVIFLNGDVDN
jgi:hypothetical protein